jgi:uncharacterized tellurite resistance protein B-like protein
MTAGTLTDAPPGQGSPGTLATEDSLAPTAPLARGELERDLGAHPAAGRGWFTRVVGFYLRRYEAKRAAAPKPRGVMSEQITDEARSLILRACVKSAFTGAAAGTVSTAATLFTAETEGFGALVALPAALVSIGGEMVYRSFVHLELTVRLAEIFDVRFDPDNQDDLWRLYALVFKAHEEKREEDDDPGRALVSEVMHVEHADVGEKIGSKVLGESVARNIVPFVGIVTSAVTNFVVTRKLGDTVRRYMRYQRALQDAFLHSTEECHENLDLLIEGMWFIFTADGKLSPEETATLARLLQRLDPVTRRTVESRFVEDELEWADRIERVSEETRDQFLHALEVAACVDKEVSLPERKILRRAAHHLGREFDLDHLTKMIGEFEEYGVLTSETKHKRWAPAQKVEASGPSAPEGAPATKDAGVPRG